MPKLKTNKAAAKRFKKTSSGKFKRGCAGARHLLTHKSAKRKKRLRSAVLVADGDQKRVERLLPYS